jgi:hypothetical protein
MRLYYLKFLTISLLTAFNTLNAQVIWKESFPVPEKGIRGNETGNIISDFEGISTWTLDYSSVQLFNSGDYAKTVATSGGRFEVCDINGEVCWKSVLIDISKFEKVNIQLEASETGSGSDNATKYLKAYFNVDEGEETSFETNSENAGNWGTALAEQREISGKILQIVVYISNHYSSDKVILDEIEVSAVEKEYPLARPGDLVINEVLFNPHPGGEDFVEIYNTSENEFPIGKLFLASRDSKNQLTQIYSLSGKNYLLAPKSYLAATKDTNAVFPYYFIDCPECFQQVTRMPSYNNDKDYIVLLNENMEIIDELYYTEKLHHPLFADVNGVSLERISVTESTNLPQNWASASTQAGYATPGYKNSQAESGNILKPKVTFEPESFSPNFDGYNDEYKIQFELEKPGYVGNIIIFDAKGRFVMQLAKNTILGASDIITWNGKNETGQRQPVGVYVVVVEIFNSYGQVFQFKDGVVLTDIW